MEQIVAKTGIELIDKHHERLLSIMDMIQIIENKTDCQSEMTLIFHKLTFYTENYFQDEELLFRQYQYPNLSKHKTDHKSFIDDLRAIQRKFLNGSTTTCSELYQFLERWNTQHILNYDNEAVDFLRKSKV